MSSAEAEELEDHMDEDEVKEVSLLSSSYCTVDEVDMGLFEKLHSESPCERDNGPDDSTRLMTDLDRT